MSETYGAAALRIALGQVGVKEQPANSNTGPQVRAYQAICAKAAGRAVTPEPWCADFFHWTYAQAGAIQPYLTPYVPYLLGWYHAHGRRLTVKQVRPGDGVIYDWQKDGVADHIEVFKRWMDARRTSFETVGGNTAVGNNSNGGQVMIRLRYVSDVSMFFRPVASRLPVGTKFDPVTGAAKRNILKRIRGK